MPANAWVSARRYLCYMIAIMIWYCLVTHMTNTFIVISKRALFAVRRHSYSRISMMIS